MVEKINLSKKDNKRIKTVRLDLYNVIEFMSLEESDEGKGRKQLVFLHWTGKGLS